MSNRFFARTHRYRGLLLASMVVVGIGAAGVVFADRDSASLDIVQDIYRTLAERIEKSGGVRVEYTVESRMRDTTRDVSVARVVAMIGPAGSFVESSQMTAARDPAVAVMVVPGRRQILVTATGGDTVRGGEGGNGFGDPIQALREKVLANCTVIEEHDTTSPDGTALRRVTIAVGGKNLGVRFERADLIFNPARREPCGYRLWYPASSLIASVGISFNRMDIEGYRADECPAPLSVVFDATGNLRPQFVGYNVTDMRNNRTMIDGGSSR